MCIKSDLQKVRVLNKLKIKSNMATVTKECKRPSAQILAYVEESRKGKEEQRL